MGREDIRAPTAYYARRWRLQKIKLSTENEFRKRVKFKNG